MWLIIAATLTVAAALQVERLESGVVLAVGKTARIVAKEWDLVITRRNPAREYQETFQPLRQQVHYVLNMLEERKVANVDIFRSRVTRLARKRTKRGLINAIGELSKTLFGTATQKDLNTVKNAVG